MSLIRNEVEWCQRVSLTPSQVADSRGFATNFRSSTMWPDTTRAQYARAQLTLPSDLTDAEWAVLVPFLQQPSGSEACPVGKESVSTSRSRLSTEPSTNNEIKLTYVKTMLVVMFIRVRMFVFFFQAEDGIREAH